jgi:hypothetical protein
MRAEEVGDAEVPVLVTDLTADEAEELLLMGDLLVAMAERDADAFDELRGKVAFDEEDLDRVLTEFAVPALDALADTPAHDYGVSKRRDKNFLKLVVSIRHHEIIERTIETPHAGGWTLRRTGDRPATTHPSDDAVPYAAR